MTGNEKVATAQDVKEAYTYGFDCGRKHGNEEGRQGAIDTTASLVGQKLHAAYQRGVAAGRQENPDSHLAEKKRHEAYQLGLQRGRDECRGCPKTGPVVSEETAPAIPIKDSERIAALELQVRRLVAEVMPGGMVVPHSALATLVKESSGRIDELNAQLESVKESLEGAHERIEQLDQNNKAHGRWHDATQFGPRIAALEQGRRGETEGTLEQQARIVSLDRMQREHSKALVELRQGLAEVTQLAEKLRTGKFSAFHSLECRVTILEDQP